MAFKMVFKRYELKYLMNEEQTEAVYEALGEHMVLDDYGHSSIRNIYFDTPNFLLARRSIAKPDYKEKLRFRSYGKAKTDSKIFVEMKKKYDGVVYKRRLNMRYDRAMKWFTDPDEPAPESQIGEEIDHMRTYYPGIFPAMMLTYEREAYFAKDGGDLRITIDSNILSRLDDVDLTSEVGGHVVLPKGYTLMEIKTMYGYPPWLTRLLCGNRLYKSSFSKYGCAFKETVMGRLPEEYYSIPGSESTIDRLDYSLLDYGDGAGFRRADGGGTV